MGNKIAFIPADNRGNILFIKDFEQVGNRFFVKYRSTYNDIPFVRTEIYLADGNQNFVITGTDGTVLFRFSAFWIAERLMEKTEKADAKA
jgi:hypothetical protein